MKGEKGIIFARESFAVDLQAEVHVAMRRAKLTRTQLAERIGWSKKHVDRFFDDALSTSKFTPGDIAEIAHGVGCDIVFKLVEQKVAPHD